MYNVSYVHFEGTYRERIHNQLYVNALQLTLVGT